MGAPVGNQFWKLRSKHGRDKLFESPGLLWEAATEYFQWVDENPFEKAEQRKGTVIIPKGFEGDVDEDLFNPVINLPVRRPYTIYGLCSYLGTHTGFFNQFKNDLKPVETEQQKDFYLVVRAIEETIYNQKFEGAASGFFNANIIARDLGLRDKTELSTPPEGEGGFNVTLKIE